MPIDKNGCEYYDVKFEGGPLHGKSGRWYKPDGNPSPEELELMSVRRFNVQFVLDGKNIDDPDDEAPASSGISFSRVDSYAPYKLLPDGRCVYVTPGTPNTEQAAMQEPEAYGTVLEHGPDEKLND